MKPETVTAGLTVVIAVFALLFGIYQGILSRQHSRISVQPKLEIDLRFQPAERSTGVYVINKGLGPAEIIAFSVKVGAGIYDVTKPQGLDEVLSFLKLSDIGVLGRAFTPGSSFVAGEEQHLLLFNPPDSSFEEALEVYQQLQLLSFHIEYKSFYEQQYILDYPIQ